MMDRGEMLLTYRRTQSFLNQHQDAITAISICGDGRYLASSGLDSQIVLYVRTQDSFDFHVLRKLRARSVVLSLVWCEPGRLVAGTLDGQILAISVTDAERFEDVKLKVRGFMAHFNPVEFLAFNATQNAPFKLASCGRDVVRLWSWDDFDSPWKPGELIELASASRDKPAMITSLNVVNTQGATSRLFITYFHHGIICYDWPNRGPPHRRVYWKQPFVNCASCSVSPEGSYVVLYQPNHGFSRQTIEGGTMNTFSTPEKSPPIYLPSTVAHNGVMVITGGIDGEVTIWDCDYRPGARVQTLQTQVDDCAIQAITTYNMQDEQNLYIFIGTGRQGSDNHVEIWRTFPRIRSMP